MLRHTKVEAKEINFKKNWKIKRIKSKIKPIYFPTQNYYSSKEQNYRLVFERQGWMEQQKNRVFGTLEALAISSSKWRVYIPTYFGNQ